MWQAGKAHQGNRESGVLYLHQRQEARGGQEVTGKKKRKNGIPWLIKYF
jgi:hypothetical protein